MKLSAMKTKCPRCGQTKYKANMQRHVNLCGRIPKPAYLAEQFRRNPNMTLTGLAKQYSCNKVFIEERLKLGGLTKVEMARRGQRVKVAKITKTKTKSHDPDTCQRCHVLLDHPLVPHGRNSLCGWCQVEMVVI